MQPPLFTGARRRGGLLELGPFVDKPGEAQYPLYTDGSMWSAVIVGDVGLGKTALAESIVVSALSGGDTAYWCIAADRNCCPILAKHAGWFVSVDRAGDMLSAVEKVLETRGNDASTASGFGFTPSADQRGLLLVIDECQLAFVDHDVAGRWAKVVNQGVGLGIAVLAITQTLDVEAFGGNTELRSALMGGSTVALRSTCRRTRHIADLPIDPRSLPKIPGYAYIRPAAHTGVASGTFRNRNTGEEAARWLAEQPRPAHLA